MSIETQVSIESQTAIETQSVGQHGHALPESSGVDARHLLWLGGAALALLGGAIAVLGTIYRDEVPVKTMPPPQSFPQPRVQTGERAELEKVLAAQRRRLEAFRWADADHTRVQIPIERAMKLIAAKGAHAYDPIAASAAASSSPEAGAERAVTPAATPSGEPGSAAAGAKPETRP